MLKVQKISSRFMEGERGVSVNKFRCEKCGSLNTEIEEKGTQTGLYCCDCGKWIKWLSQEEIRVFNARYQPGRQVKQCEECLKELDKKDMPYKCFNRGYTEAEKDLKRRKEEYENVGYSRAILDMLDLAEDWVNNNGSFADFKRVLRLKLNNKEQKNE